MEIDTAVSGPAPEGNTGDAKADSNALDAAFEKAFAGADLDEEMFAEEAPLSLPTTPKPAPENAAAEKPEDGTETATELKADKTGRLHGEKGRFAPKAGDAPPPASEAMSAPAHWDSAKREAFGTLPAEAQKVVLDLTKSIEAGVTRKSQELSQKAQFAEAVLSAINDSDRQQLARAGLNEAQGLDRLLQLNRMATQDPVRYARWFFETAGLRPEQVFPVTGAPQAQPQGNAAAPPADSQFLHLNDKVRGLEGQLDSYRREREAEDLRQAQRVIDRFASQTDDAGNPMHPHFERVRQRVAGLLGADPEILAIADPAERLTRAYETAVYADPDIRAQLIEADLQKKEAARQKQAEVEKARRAQAPVRSAPTVSPSASRPKTISEAVDAAFERLGL